MNLLAKLPYDKALHIIGGLIIFAAVHFFFGSVAGVVAAAIIGAAKELIYDKWMGKGNPDVLDFVATAAGGILGFLCTLVR